MCKLYMILIYLKLLDIFMIDIAVRDEWWKAYISLILFSIFLMNAHLTVRDIQIKNQTV